MSVPELAHVAVPGGAGYVGSVLVPRLLARGHRVTVLDRYVFGTESLAAVRDNPRLTEIEGDVRDPDAVRRCVSGADAVIHLACVSNDPSCDLDPELSRTINLESFEPFVEASVGAGVRRFIFASSSSVYGVSDAERVTEDHPRHPITHYNRFKGLCEDVLFRYTSPAFTTVAVRPATVCGPSPRQRLDLTVNILTTHAVCRGLITVFGGEQKRPNIHIGDMVDLYELLLDARSDSINGETFNAGYQNHRVAELAEIVKRVVEREMPERAPVSIETTASDDPRSYHICCDKLESRLGFRPRRTIEDAVGELLVRFRAGELPDALEDDSYYNVRVVRAKGL